MMKFQILNDEKLIDFSNLEVPVYENNILHIVIMPFIYLDGRKPRLPRKQSNGYKLIEDTKLFFNTVLSELTNNFDSENDKFEVFIKVNKGKDKLGSADLDNYCKAILDGITSTKKVWKDDKQIDGLFITRDYVEEVSSNIRLQIKQRYNGFK